MAFVGVRDLDRAARFYGEVLGLPCRDERPVALVAEAGGAALRITAVEAPVRAPYTVLGWVVPALDPAIDDLVGRGVEFLRLDGMDQDQRAVWTAPSGARVAWFRDPDGNLLSLTEGGAAPS
jgi:catechol 2,3-dioxygenase-like lactoylglutathione lyase family enzyme